MATSMLPPVATLPSLSDSARAKILDLLFEPSPALHAQVLELTAQAHGSYDALIDAIQNVLEQLAASGSALDRLNRLDAILGSHPRLGASKVDSAQSRAEQAQLNDGDGGSQTDEARKLKDLNDDYERTFPSLKYVVFVNGRPRSEIMADMQRRIERQDIEKERHEGIQAMCDIAKDRAKKLQAAASDASR